MNKYSNETNKELNRGICEMHDKLTVGFFMN